MAYKFPWTNYHELNLDWILDTVKKLFAQTEQNNEIVSQYDGRLTEVELTADNAQTAAEQAQQNSTAALDLAQGAQTTATQAQQAAAQAQQAAGQAQTAAGQALEAAATAQQTATQAQQTAQNFDGRIRQAEDNAASALQAAQAFDEQVQGAITAANNANTAATNAVTVAAEANQKSDRTAAQLNAQINTITQTINSQLSAAETAIENKGEEVLESIPEDYTELSNDVSNLRGSLASVETSSTASKAYLVGDLLVYDSQLYKVVSAIATGGTLTPGTNITEVTVESELYGKQDSPLIAGTAGQILSLDSSLKPVWANPASPINEFLYSEFRTYPDGTITAGGRSFTVKGHLISTIGNSTSSTFYNINITGSVLRARSGTKSSFATYDTDFVPCSIVTGKATTGSPFYAGAAVYLKRMITQFVSGSDPDSRGKVFIFLKDSNGNVNKSIGGAGNYYDCIWNLTELCRSYDKFAVYFCRDSASAAYNLSALFELSYEPLIYNT